MIEAADALVQIARENPEAAISAYRYVNDLYIFEQSYNNIFGTQFELLEHLVEKGSNGEKYVNLYEFFHKFMERLLQLSPTTTQIDQYMSFLSNRGFMKIEEDGETVTITPLGMKFVLYIKSQYTNAYKFKPF